MKMFRQIGAVTAMNLRSLPQRAGTSLVIVIGIAGVVAVLVSVLAMSTGMIETMENTGRDDRAIVLRNGSAAETGSALGRDAARLIEDAAGVKRDAPGKPILSAEALRLVNLFRKEDGAEVNVALRGVGPKLAAAAPGAEDHRRAACSSPRVTEVIVGKAAHARVQGPERRRSPSTRAARPGRSSASSPPAAIRTSPTLMTDAETLISADQRGGFQSVTVHAGVGRRVPEVQGLVERESGARRRREPRARVLPPASKTISKVIYVIAYVVGGIMAVGAIFSALNTMYSAVSARLREIATLRAIGFGATAMVMSVLAEALVLALIGGVIGALIAWLFFNGNRSARRAAAVRPAS